MPEYKCQARYKSRIGVIFLYSATKVYSILENRWKRYFGHHQVDKTT